jgi:non-canonical poly(A) RNA polymerase PAPD5/7
MKGGDTNIYHDTRNVTHRNDHDPEESGKYDIGRQPPKKRRRKGREEDNYTVFIADDDDGGMNDDESVDKAEAREYSVNGEMKPGKPLSSADTDRKRNYWLSKAKGLGEDTSDSV